MKIPGLDSPFNDSRNIALFSIYDFFQEEPAFTRLITDAVEASFASIAMLGNTETAMRKVETLKSRPALHNAAMRSIVNHMKREQSFQPLYYHILITISGTSTSEPFHKYAFGFIFGQQYNH